jgi:signal transduction histidine kinase
MFNCRVNLVVPLFVVFLLSFRLVAQKECLSIEKKMELVFETDLSKYEALFEEFVKCEESNRIERFHSRSEYHKARALLKNGEIEKADQLINASIKIQKDPRTLIDLKLLKSASFILKGQLDSCLKISNEVIHFKNCSSVQLAKAYQYNANCHSKLGNRQYQYNSLRSGLYFARKTNDSVINSHFNNSLGVYFNLGSTKVQDQWKALYYYKKAISLCPNRDSSLKVTYLINLGNVYSTLKLNDKSLSVLRQAFNNYANHLNTEQCFDVTMSMGSTYLIKEDLEKAGYFYQKAFELLNELPSITSSDISIYYNLSELEYMKGNITKSRDYLKTYVTLNEKYLAKENANKIIEIQERFNAKARLTQILELKNRNQQAKLDNYFLQMVMLLSVVILTILIFLYLNIQRKKALAEKIKVKNEIKKAALEATENEKLRFSRDLHDSLGGSLTVVGLLVYQAKESNPDQAQKFEELYQLVQNSIHDLRRICRDLFPSEILISGVVSSIGFYYEKLSSLHPSVKFDFTSENFKLEKGFSINIFRIVQELTNNSLKYAEATRIETNMLVNDGRLEFAFSDNGKGVDLKTLHKGLGLHSIEERAKAYKGTFKIESKPEKGFVLLLSFPIEDLLLMK